MSGRTVLAVIAARGGSKGLPGKNVADLGGKPVVAWSVAAGRGSRCVDRLILSSDDPRIIRAARRAGCEVPFRRPARLATDTASVHDVLFHALDALDENFDYVVLLQAASPLRAAGDIDACVRLCHRGGAPVVSVAPVAKPPHWTFALDSEGRLKPVVEARRVADRRQDLPPIYAPNGAVYVARTEWLRRHRSFFGPETRAHVMPAERSVDIDTRLDLLLARALVEKNSQPKRRKS
ncbi:MAG: acylneuraminate cytidylyltransferase family protein [Rhodospirillales bacterium]|nr:acylneuraminate cytidylyltransferase family protein [Rhodospirillales bacterium]